MLNFKNRFIGISVLVFFSSYLFSEAQWVKLIDNKANEDAFTALTVSGEKLFAVAMYGGIFISNDSGSTWKASNNGITNKLFKSIYINGKTIFIDLSNEDGSSYTGNPYFSTDNGETWNPSKNTDLQDINIKAMSFFHNYFLVGGLWSRGMFMSSDTCSSFIEINNGIDTNDRWINTIYVFKNRIFIGTNGGIYISDDTCKNWIIKKNNLFAIDIYKFDNINDTLFAGGTFGFFKSTDNGETWFMPDTTFTGNYINDIKVYDKYIFAASERGFFASIDNGKSWYKKNTGLMSLNCSNINVLNHEIFITTKSSAFPNYGSINKIKDIEMVTSVEDVNVKENQINISPNPVTDILNIESTNKSYKIEIFSILGLKVLETNFKEKIDVSKLLPGAYFVRVGDKTSKFVKIY